MGIYLICYLSAYLFARAEYYWLSGLVLLGAALWLYWLDYRNSGNALHLRALFGLFWVGGEGLSCLKLSQLQKPWSGETWCCFLVAYLCFWLSFEWLSQQWGRVDRRTRESRNLQGTENGLYAGVLGITGIASIAFLIEALYLGYVPLFTVGVPHAYSYFHITGLHYFTVSCVLVPSLAVLYFYVERGRDSMRAAIVLLCSVVSLLIPILCVSRFQLIFAVLLAVFSGILTRKQVHVLLLAGGAFGMVLLYVLLTVARAHDVSYLNGIFEMKRANMPIFITQPYMYIANNYDNFNCLVNELPSHTFGLRMLFPLWALTGLKFLLPQLVNFPIFVTKTELTTLTLFYDAYYDFGILGVGVFALLLGAVAYALMREVSKIQNPVGYLIYAQFAAYLLLSFFSTWFSNPTTWFYFIVTAAVYVLCGRRRWR
ncbi:MAG: O-antigen polymerase [bacterium]|nr:O-antigen polymerase [bacterium]